MPDNDTSNARDRDHAFHTPHSAFRIIVMGTGPFAVPMFRAILNSPHRAWALVTRPDRPAHRRERAPVNPMRDAARENGVEVFEPESINSPEAGAWLREKSADLFVVCDYGQILSRETLALAKLGGINLHASLLPKYRGAAPINWAIYYGEVETGVTVIHMTPQLDAGPALVQKRTPIGPTETTSELETRLAEVGAGAVLEAIDILARGKHDAGIPQDSSLASKAPRLKKEDGLVDWSRSAGEICNQVRALEPWPKTYTFSQRAGHEPLRLILERVHAIEAVAAVSEIPPAGSVIAADHQELLIACGQGVLEIDSLQPAGKRAMTAAEFLRGHPLKVGDRLG
jgi:methionyl-tRNA formyltransferase